MAKKKADPMPAGWTLAVEVEETEETPGDFRAYKTIADDQNQRIVEQHAQTLDALVSACAEYDRLRG